MNEEKPSMTVGGGVAIHCKAYGGDGNGGEHPSHRFVFNPSDMPGYSFEISGGGNGETYYFAREQEDALRNFLNRRARKRRKKN